jgi:hypothetical protein
MLYLGRNALSAACKTFVIAFGRAAQKVVEEIKMELRLPRRDSK